MFWMFVVAAVSYLDRSNISIAAVPIQLQFGLTDIQLGGVFSAFVLGYALTQPLAGRIADRFGPWRAVGAGIVCWSVLTTATALVPSGFPWSLSALAGVRLCLGMGESVVFPASNRLVAAWMPKSERGLANGLIFSGVGLGAAIAPPVTTWLMVTRNWHWAFFASAVIGLLVLCVWMLVVRDRPEDHPWVTAGEVAHIRTTAVMEPPSSPPIPWRLVLKNRQVLLLSASYFTYGYVAYVFFTWFYKYLSSVRGLDLKSSALYAMAPFMGMALASPLGGWLSDRLTLRVGARAGRCWTAAAALATAAVFVALAVRVTDPRAACLVLAGGAGALYLSQSAYWTLSADLGGNSAGTVSGIMNLFNQLGGVLTASLTPWLAGHFGWSFSFEVLAGVCLLGAILWLFIEPPAASCRRNTSSQAH